MHRQKSEFLSFNYNEVKIVENRVLHLEIRSILSTMSSQIPRIFISFFRPLFLLVLGLLERFPGDISAAKWPEGLQYLGLSDTKVSGASPVHFCRFYAPGELSLRAAPAANLLLPHPDFLPTFCPHVPLCASFRRSVEGSVARSASEAQSVGLRADHRCVSASRASRSICSPKEHKRI